LILGIFISKFLTKEEVRRIGKERINKLKELKESSPFPDKYKELIELEKAEVRKVLNQIQEVKE